VLLWRLCWQMLVPPQSLQVLLWRLCWQMLVPPQSLHPLLRRLCWQMLVRLRSPSVAPHAPVRLDGKTAEFEVRGEEPFYNSQKTVNSICGRRALVP